MEKFKEKKMRMELYYVSLCVGCDVILLLVLGTIRSVETSVTEQLTHIHLFSNCPESPFLISMAISNLNLGQY